MVQGGSPSHVHVPSTQSGAVAVHTFPHVPQLISSLDRSRHDPEQHPMPGSHTTPPHRHSPSEQTTPEGHTFPHSPQLLGSDATVLHPTSGQHLWVEEHAV